MEIIPALDLRGGQVVRLEQGDYARETVFDADPGNAARRFVSAGATRLHVVDLDGARSGEPRNLAGVETNASRPSLRLRFSSSRASLASGRGPGTKRCIYYTPCRM